jgi:hypothetical protein
MKYPRDNTASNGTHLRSHPTTSMPRNPPGQGFMNRFLVEENMRTISISKAQFIIDIEEDIEVL